MNFIMKRTSFRLHLGRYLLLLSEASNSVIHSTESIEYAVVAAPVSYEVPGFEEYYLRQKATEESHPWYSTVVPLIGSASQFVH